MRLEKDSIHKQILELVYPELKYGEDPDIERYFELRSQGRMLDALAVYQGKLKPRYPDDAQRIELLALYRRNSPAFPQYLFGLLEERAGIIIRQLKNNIDSLLRPLEGLSLKNTYKVLKAVEIIARLLPEDNDRALDMLAFYEPVVQILEYRQKEFKILSRLLSDFYEQTAIKELEAFDFLSLNESALLEQKRREEEYRRHENYFNIDNIEFDESDRQAIEISSTLERNEDKVLAYCYKYWLRIDDAAFERIIFLYSQKNKSRHYDIFRTIKFCRKRKYSDDDILTMVATSLSTEYSYTVQGDIYMQDTWRRLKANLYGVSVSGRQVGCDAPQVEEVEAPVPPVRKQKARKAPSSEKKASRLKRVKEPEGPGTSLAKELERRRKLLSKPAKIQKSDIPGLVYTGSISDKIKKIAGRSYDVYQDLFLSKVRTFIQDELQKNRIAGGRGFGDTLSLAEDVLYACIKKNYLNTYFDWMNAPENKKLKEYGFDLPAIDGIVENCMRHIMEKERVV